MKGLILVASLLGDWLLYTFPLYQGLMELGEYDELMDRYGRVSKRRQTVSAWWWLIPIIKVHMERKRAVGILGELSKGRHEREKVMGFMHKATAWFYVALAGWLKMAVSAYELLEGFRLEPMIPMLIASVLLLTAAGIANVYYRISDRHRWNVEHRLRTAERPERISRRERERARERERDREREQAHERERARARDRELEREREREGAHERARERARERELERERRRSSKR
ncbi:hypothetical protein BACT_0915 [Bifidobacterium actinocoloniiforme DSM 22766]|uniref:Uncharacterized protein n=1 Tax=Bifidobacterium actinocoloniiforme DSM 22766 TaxID=1437605 RepID=A0A086Z113_9BIFI|nr:hypothetical protein [Bifidobacterium actinocoloniiforme]KFI40213.1 hypothetical protein BACT_0915 [Bifidobacterium actinocoloniiforme DSM 22766]